MQQQKEEEEEEEEDYKEQVSWVGVSLLGGGATGKMTLHDAQPTEKLFFGR
jgi:hypothetical protein